MIESNIIEIPSGIKHWDDALLNDSWLSHIAFSTPDDIEIQQKLRMWF